MADVGPSAKSQDLHLKICCPPCVTFPPFYWDAYLHIPQFLQWSPVMCPHPGLSHNDDHDKGWPVQEAGECQQQFHHDTWGNRWQIHGTPCILCATIYDLSESIYILCRQCGSWNFNTGARENDSVSDIVAVGVHSLSFTERFPSDHLLYSRRVILQKSTAGSELQVMLTICKRKETQHVLAHWKWVIWKWVINEEHLRVILLLQQWTRECLAKTNLLLPLRSPTPEI